MADLKRQIERVRLLHEDDLLAGAGEVYLPDALSIKYPNAARASRYGRRHEPDQVDDFRRFHARSRCGALRADLCGGAVGAGDRFVSAERFVNFAIQGIGFSSLGMSTLQPFCSILEPRQGVCHAIMQLLVAKAFYQSGPPSR